MIDSIQEILSTLKKNKTRAIMTGFSIAWGIFMLILLLGSGKGLQNGMENNFRSTSKNALWIWSRRTQVAYDGIKAGRYIKFTDDDMKAISDKYKEDIDNFSGRFFLRGDAAITYNNEYGDYFVEGVLPEFNKIQMFKQISGRYINDPDINKFRKVIVISLPVVKNLFKKENPIGKYLKINGIPFKVIGTIEDYEDKERKRVYIPLSTAKRVFNGGNRLSEMAIATNALSVEENKRIEESVVKTLSDRHHISPDDKQAIGIFNTLEHFKQAQGVFAGIRIFVWVIGIMTIIAGIVGVSNIMIILVKERTKEIGIRKAIGASPWSIIRLILSESTFITIFAGFFGLVCGMALLAGASAFIQHIASQNPEIERSFYNPSADFDVAFTALIVLVFAGIIAGYIPSQKAAAIKPIEALHDE
ncbi:MAG: ABC transporter permease [Marinilabiliaceae bacterium]|nr:ABC transporter permease [Marinilabiliaceae bacterium]